MTDAQKFIDWLAGHPCTERELWLLQNMLGTVYGFESDIAQEASQAWERSRRENMQEKTETEHSIHCCCPACIR